MDRRRGIVDVANQEVNVSPVELVIGERSRSASRGRAITRDESPDRARAATRAPASICLVWSSRRPRRAGSEELGGDHPGAESRRRQADGRDAARAAVDHRAAPARILNEAHHRADQVISRPGGPRTAGAVRRLRPTRWTSHASSAVGPSAVFNDQPPLDCRSPGPPPPRLPTATGRPDERVPIEQGLQHVLRRRLKPLARAARSRKSVGSTASSPTPHRPRAVAKLGADTVLGGRRSSSRPRVPAHRSGADLDEDPRELAAVDEHVLRAN